MFYLHNLIEFIKRTNFSMTKCGLKTFKKEFNKKKIQKSIITNNNLSSDEVGFKFAKKIGNKGFLTGTIVELFDGSSNDVSRRCVYDDGDEENLSKKQISSLKKIQHILSILALMMYNQAVMSDLNLESYLKMMASI